MKQQTSNKDYCTVPISLILPANILDDENISMTALEQNLVRPEFQTSCQTFKKL